MIAVYKHTDRDGAVIKVWVREDARLAEAWVTPEQAPALALAILEAAGFEADETTTTGWAVKALSDHSAQQAEAKEQAALDKEADALWVAYSDGRLNLPTWAGASDANKKAFRRLARKAREIHGAKP